ncbi:LysR family transcriptional regulator [Thalassovita sp.]|uniref:LysR family transcriptional regulator n=1 Tax=Thalassovita sp. TaxID=1979401 RepID=UPI003B597DBB
MEWKSLTFDWNRARAFLVVVEEGSLSAAARALGQAQPTLGRQVTALEQELGVTLFQRVGRGLVPTQAGLDLAEHVRAMGEAAMKFSLAASGQVESVEGTVTITASEMLSASLLPPMIGQIRTQHPGIRLEVVAANTQADLLRREADIAIRNTDPGHPDLIARKICDDAGHLYGTRAYLDGLSDLSQAEIIGFDWTDLLRQRLSQMGHIFAPEQFTVTSANHLVQLAMVQAGVGLGVFPTHVGQTHGLIKAVPDAPPMLYPVWLVAHKELRTSRRVRLVFDLLASGISARLKP